MAQATRSPLGCLSLQPTHATATNALRLKSLYHKGVQNGTKPLKSALKTLDKGFGLAYSIPNKTKRKEQMQ